MNRLSSNAENPYMIITSGCDKNTNIYDYSSYSNRLGKIFVASICDHATRSIESMRNKGVNRTQAMSKEVSHLHSFFSALQVFLGDNNVHSADEMNADHWRSFEIYWINCVVDNLAIASSTKKSYKSRFVSVLRQYAEAGLISKGSGSNAVKKDDPYYVLQTSPIKGSRPITYEYAKVAHRIDPQFLASACALIRQLRETAGVKEKTWQDNYVNRFDHFITELCKFLDAEDYDSIQAFGEGDWRKFVTYLEDSIMADRVSDRTGELISARTKTKDRLTTNKLLANMAVTGLLPRRYEIPPPDGRTRATDGNSKFTQRGWSVKPKNYVILSPFAFVVKNHNRKKSYDYEIFQPLARCFLLTAVPLLLKLYSNGTEGQAKKYHHVLILFLSFLEKTKGSGAMPDFFSALETEQYDSIDELNWEKLLYEWRDHVISGDEGQAIRISVIVKHQKIILMNQLWRTLADAGAVPGVELKGIINAEARQGKRGRPSLAQLIPIKTKDIQNEDQDSLVNRLTRYFDEDEKAEAVEFINALCAHLTFENAKSLTLETLIDEIGKLNSIRLDEIRRCAETDFLKWHAHWLYGQSVLESATHSADELVDLLDRQERPVSDRRRNASALISGDSEQHLGNLLTLMLAAVDGNTAGINGRYHHARIRWGGIDRLQSYLHPHKRATLALWVLLLVDTGANCEVVREMPVDCLNKLDDPTHMSISFGLKARAGYRRITDCLAIEPQPGQQISAIKAVRHYQMMSARYRASCNQKLAKLLFLDMPQSHVVGLTEWLARDYFKEFLLDHSELKNLHARPSFIRPSYLLKLQHSDPQAPMEIAQVQADHTSTTTTAIYTLRSHTKLLYNQKIREFTKAYQAVIIESIVGAAEKLGISQEQAIRLFSDAARSGLGVACLNPEAGVQPGTRAGESCTRLDACPGCEMRYVVGTVNNIADLMLFERYLRSMEKETSKTSPVTWETQWIPWLVLAEVALAKFSQGETASAYVQAQTQANARLSYYKPFPLI
jgi:hypothetical protein